MDDLISRQFLIEAFKDEFYAMYSDDFNYMIKWFENLPAADSSEFCDQLWQIAYEHGKAETRHKAKDEGERRPAECPLVEVPKHGRLIDADALMSTIKEHDYCLYDRLTDTTKPGMFTFGIEYAICTAPTIIEAGR